MSTFQVSMFQGDESLPFIRVDELELQRSSSAQNSVRVYKFNGRLVVVKKLAVDVSEEALEDHAIKWNALKQHPNVSRICGISDRGFDPPFIVMPFYENGNIIEFLRQRPHLELDRQRMILEIASGMAFLHQNGLVHGQLRPSNIFVSPDGHVTVAEYDTLQTSKNPEAHRYLSPEGWTGIVSRPSDVYTFAMCALEIFTLILPWGGLSEKHVYYLVVVEKSRPDRPDEALLTDDIWNIIVSAWAEEPRSRPSFDLITRLWRGATSQFATSSISNPSLHSPLQRQTTRHLSVMSDGSGPPAYEDNRIVPASAPPTTQQFSFNRVGTVRERIEPIHGYSWYSESESSETSMPHTPPSPPIDSPVAVRQFDRRATAMAPWAAGTADLSSDSSSSSRRRSQRLASLDETHSAKYGVRLAPEPEEDVLAYDMRNLGQALPRMDSRESQRGYSRQWETKRRIPQRQTSSSHLSVRTESSNATSQGQGQSSPVLLVGALQTELDSPTRNMSAIDSYIVKIYAACLESRKEAAKFVTAGLVPVLIHILKTRAANGLGVEIVLITLGTIAHDSISSNIIWRTNTTITLIELAKSPVSEISVLSIWCLNQICRSAEIAQGLIKSSDIVSVLQNWIATGDMHLASMAVYCVGTLIQNDNIAEFFAAVDMVPLLVGHLRKMTENPQPNADHISAGLFGIARMSRSIKLAKSLTKAGCVELISHHLNKSTDPDILNWSARAVGCLMRPNSSDMARALLDAGVARGLARLPTVLHSENLQALGSLGFTVQRFSCAEWSGKIRQFLVDAGVVDSLLAALRTAAEEPCHDVQIELALAICLLGDVGGSAIRKELINAGAITILKDIGNRNPEVAKAADLAKASIAGNIWSRNTASAKTTMMHNWNGGCPEYHPPCPVHMQVL